MFTLILKLFRDRPGVVLLLLASTACAYHAPTGPTTVLVDLTSPATLQVTASPGRGTATVSALVSNRIGTPLASVTVTFSTDAGRITPESATTNAQGFATAGVIAPAGAARITATAGTLTTAALVAIQPVSPNPTQAPGPDEPPPTPTPLPQPTLPPLTVQIIATPGVAGTATTFGLAVSAPVTSVWDFGDTNPPFTTSSATTTHVYGAAGTYTVSVIVTDALSRTASAQTSVVIAAPPPAPPTPVPTLSVTLAASLSTLTAGASATLTATATPQNGAPAVTSYAWDCNGDSIPETTTPAPINVATCLYPTVGFVASRVTVTAGSLTASGATLVTVTPPAPSPPAPTLVASLTCFSATHPMPSACNVSATYGGTAVASADLNVDWDWGDGLTTERWRGRYMQSECGHLFRVRDRHGDDRRRRENHDDDEGGDHPRSLTATPSRKSKTQTASPSQVN